MPKNKNKNIVLYVGTAPLETIEEFKKSHKQYKFAIIFQKNSIDKEDLREYKKVFDILLPCNLNSPSEIIESLKPYEKKLLAVSCRSEPKIPDFIKLVPYVPYMHTPTAASLEWSIDKIKMRRRFKAYSPKITPKYQVVKKITKKAIKKIEKNVGFPLVIKPSGLAQSLLVTVCYHEEELEMELKKTFRKIESLHSEYKGAGKEDEDKVLVEQLLEGDQYSIDGHVDGKGTIHFYPPVHVTTGKAVGFDDFFGYKQIIPANLHKNSLENLKIASTDAVHALGLRSTTFHAELLKTEGGWKIIEVAPRPGGFRDKMHRLSYGSDQTLNDIRIRIPRKPIIKNKVLGHTAVLKMFAKKEGTITKMTGVQKVEALKSFHDINVRKKVGERAVFAKNGGKSVFTVTLFNKKRSKLLADIRRLEKMVKIETK